MDRKIKKFTQIFEDSYTDLNLILFVLNRVNLNINSLNEILYLSALIHLDKYLKPLSNFIFIKKDNESVIIDKTTEILKHLDKNYSPLNKSFKDTNITLIYGFDYFIKIKEGVLFAKKTENLMYISKSEIECLNKAIEIFKEHFFEINENRLLDYCLAFKLTKIDDEINFKDMYLSSAAFCNTEKVISGHLYLSEYF